VSDHPNLDPAAVDGRSCIALAEKSLDMLP
jgi:hypothetical protein